MNEDETTFDRFWQASSLDRFNVKEFAQQLNSYDSDDKELLLSYPLAQSVLPNPKSKPNTLARKRKSERVFSSEPLSHKEIGLILSSFRAWNGLEHRSYPSAGATYTTEIFAFIFNSNVMNGNAIYYDPEKHGTVVVSDTIPPWNEAKKTLNIETTGTPQMLIIFVTFPQRVTAKYGERGGRFALIETGAAVQQLALQIADSSKLKGVGIGGMLDETWKQILGLEDTDAHITLGYLVGK